MTLKHLLFVFFFMLSFSACSSEQPKMAPGRCNVNTDCPQGHACRETYCKDIYFPDEDIRRK